METYILDDTIKITVLINTDITHHFECYNCDDNTIMDVNGKIHTITLATALSLYTHHDTPHTPTHYTRMKYV